MIIDNHLEIIATLYIIFSMVAIVLTVADVTKNHKISIMNMCSAMYIATLCIVPAIIFFGYVNGLRATRGIRFEESAAWTFYVQLLFTIIGYAILCFGYRIKQKEPKIYPIAGNRRLLLICVIFTAVSAVSLLLWSSGYGGIGGLLANADGIRSGWYLSTNAFTFLKHFVPLSLIASWMLFNLLIRKEIKSAFKNTGIFLLFACNVALSSIYIQANDGRLLLAVYVFLFFVIYLKYQYEVNAANIVSLIIKFGIILLIASFVLFNADTILSMLRGEDVAKTESFDTAETLSREFSFIISGTQNALFQQSSSELKLMVGNDVVNGLFAWLPTSLKPVILEDVWDYNTQLLRLGGRGQSPTSIVAQSLYDLSLIGVVLIPFLYGMLIKKMEIILESRKGNVFFDTVYVALGFYLCKGIPYFSVYNIMMNTFFIFLAIIIYNTVQKIK